MSIPFNHSLLGVDGHNYATHLYELARTLTLDAKGTAALAMARSSRLEQRIVAVLDPVTSRHRTRLSFRVVMGLLVAVLAIPLAALSLPEPPATIYLRTTGLPALPEVNDTPSAVDVATTIRSVRTDDRPGGSEAALALPEVIEYSTPPLYSDEARDRRIEGTVALEVRVDVSGRPDVPKVLRGLGHGLDENARLAVGRWKFRPAHRAGRAVESITRIDVVFSLATDVLNELIANDMATRVGPGVSPPRVVRRVAVVQPAHADPATTEGSVVLDVVLLEDGRPRVVRIARSLDADSDQAAIRAFEQWRFSPARENGLPVKVRMSAEIRFHRTS